MTEQNRGRRWFMVLAVLAAGYALGALCWIENADRRLNHRLQSLETQSTRTWPWRPTDRAFYERLHAKRSFGLDDGAAEALIGQLPAATREIIARAVAEDVERAQRENAFHRGVQVQAVLLHLAAAIALGLALGQWSAVGLRLRLALVGVVLVTLVVVGRAWWLGVIAKALWPDQVT